jgi:uncharacterized damage-inducible protein DinB
MYKSINEFVEDWRQESAATSRVLNELTDESISHEWWKEGRTLGDLAWHLVTTIPEMMTKTGLAFTGAKNDDPTPNTAVEIKSAYDYLAAELIEQVERDWKDETLKQEDELYGMQWPRGLTLRIMLRHEIHHRGQLTAVMRIAGLKVPGVYGPAYEEEHK